MDPASNARVPVISPSWRQRLLAPALASVLATAWCSPLRADPSSVATARLATALPYAEALARVDETPALRSLGSAAGTLRRAASDVSGLASDLELTGEAGPRLGDAAQLQARIDIAQSFALASLGAARKSAAETRASAFSAERTALRTVRRIEAASAWLDTYGAQRTLETARAESALASELVVQTTRALALGEATVADVADTEAYASEAQLTVLATEGEWMDARLQLSSTLSSGSHVLDVTGDPPDFPPAAAAEVRAMLADLERAPAPAAAEQRRLAVMARSRELEAQHASTLRVGLAVDHGDPETWTPMAVLGVTLPWTGRVARERADLHADAQLIEAERSQSMIDARLQIERVLHEIEHFGRVVQLIETEVIPAFERGVSARARLFAEGEITAFELITTRRALLAQRVRRVRARVQWLRALVNFHELRAVTQQRNDAPSVR